LVDKLTDKFVLLTVIALGRYKKSS